jgi:dTDP-4-amino-4,6-dideoxygalactose transaminase
MSVSEIPLFKVFMADTVQDAVARVLSSGYLGEGEEVTAFERAIAERLGISGVLTVSAATSGL